MDLEEQLTHSQRATLDRSKEQLINIAITIKRYPSALLGIVIIVGFAAMALLAPIIAPYDPGAADLNENNLPKSLQPPSPEHIFGTTHMGQDVFSQWLWGARISLLVGFLAGLSVLVIGASVGLMAGYYRGLFDLVVMRVVDILYGTPTEPLILILALIFGGSMWMIVLAFVLVLWRSMARVVRAETLSVANRPFVKVAKASGASDFRIIFTHIAPNLVPIMFIEATLMMAWAILVEAGMSFLGVGTQDAVSWGTMLQATFQSGGIREAWWWVLPPGISITLLVMSFFYISRAVEEITNPELKTRK